jgi:hypothetical protein
MRKLIFLGTLAGLLLPLAALAQSNLDGTWRVDMKRAAHDPKPIVVLVQKGIDKCDTCRRRVPPYF